jgi:Receptor family ligand binding region/Poly(ADP-ribose) polymerase catalytic domain
MNLNRDYEAYLDIINNYLRHDGIDEYKALPDYAAETMVDSILALAMALSKLAPQDREKGDLVTATVRNLTFNGVNGHVAFTAKGDRAKPIYSVFNAQATNDGTLKWVDVGSIGVSGSATEPGVGVEFNKICLVDPFGCNSTEAPSGLYPLPPTPLPLWVFIAIPIAVSLMIALIRYLRSKRRKDLKALEDKIHGLDDTIEKGEIEPQGLIADRYVKPDNWIDVPDTNTVLVDVSPFKTEYWDVLARLQRDMPDVRMSRLWRVQNHSLWAFYTFHRDRFTMNGIANHNEREVWHGTTNLDPDVIYRDRQDGFMMQFARMGIWGRGLYFAEQSVYSDAYSYKPTGPSWQPAFSDRPIGEADEREMFLTKLLVGNAVTLDQNNSLVVPPYDPATPGQRYNTVTGTIGGSPVYIVYENGRAYPSYLVRYYKGPRDRKRTPFETHDEAKNAMSPSLTSPSSVGSSCGHDDLPEASVAPVLTCA